MNQNTHKIKEPNGKLDSFTKFNIDISIFYNYIISQLKKNVQHKWKFYDKHTLSNKYKSPRYQSKWKIYDAADLVSELPDEITPMQVIEPPAGYKVTNNTKIKYLELYPEFITYADEYIGELDDTGRFKQPGAYLVTWFRDNGYDDGITQFYEALYEKYDGNLIKMMMEFSGVLELTVQELRDRYMELMMKEEGAI